ncbi:MAG: hypothetical protein ABSD50_16420 [Smithella sp.]
MATNDLYSYLKQRQALSGQSPANNMVDNIVQGQLSSAYDNAIQEQAVQQKQHEFDQQIQEQEQARSTATATGIGQTAAHIGAMYGMSDSHFVKDNVMQGIDAAKDFINPQITPPAYIPAATQGVGSVASSTGLNTVTPSVVPTEAAMPTVSGASGFSQIPTDPSLVSQAPPSMGISIAPSATGGSEVAAPGIVAGAGGSVGGAIGTGVGAITGSETAQATGTALGTAIGSGISYAAPYAAVGNLADRLLVRPLIKDDKTLKTIEDIFNPIGAIEDLF